MKKIVIIYWVTTGLIFLFDAVIPAFTSHTELAVEGVRHLGYPDYFRILLTVFKVLGGVLLIVPVVPPRLKEWAYAGFTFNFVAAFSSHWVVDGPGVQTFFPLFILAILMVSYVSYHKIRKHRLQPVAAARQFTS